MDDIVEDILSTDDPVIFKVDVPCAFRNLCVNPVDAVKFGISWNDQFCIDLSIAFCWTHMSAAFQMTSDTIAFMMKDLGCKVDAYIDDYVVVAPKSRANEFFHALASLLQDLGLPVNLDKKIPLSEVITYLGIQIDISKATISIDPGKLRVIYLECLGTQHKNILPRKVCSHSLANSFISTNV